MKTFIQPTRRKIGLFFIIVAIIFLGTNVLFMINERDLAGVFLYPLGKVPITLFNTITGYAFEPNDCGFLCFPTLPQILFILAFDTILIYLTGCGIEALRQKHSETQT